MGDGTLRAVGHTMRGWQLLLIGLITLADAADAANRLSDERIVFQLGDFGQIEMALYPEVRASPADSVTV